MSREAWGDEGDLVPEGFVTDELYEEALANTRRLLDAVQGFVTATDLVALGIGGVLAKAKLLATMASVRDELI